MKPKVLWIFRKTRHLTEAGIIVFLALFAISFLLDYTTANQKEIQGKVVKIYDGDTMTVIVNNKKLSIRMFGIDAPELKQKYGIESRDNLIKMCPLNSNVTLQVKDKDKYKRTVAVIMCNGQNLNSKQVENGFAWAYTDYSWGFYSQQKIAESKK
ncbi:thermonuclease family protein [Helicobacter rodentium]|uniref:thermonuclease family protein n=1 Tax=Helicobacter rodentium TaxID=59617 RepID=UPI0025A68730|nr:thermonuclease family protein [Helicobacter rodentium]